MQGYMAMRSCTAALIGLGLVWSTPARADRIDAELIRRAQGLMKDLRAKGYQSVGILKFQVQKGDKAPSFDTGTLNTTMALRLEEALVRANDENKPMGITLDASQAALAQNPKATYLTADGRRQLFDLRYPLAWGKDKVSVNAFLTGTVTLSPDRKTTTVKVDVFDKDNLEPRSLLSFDVPTDRSILSDAGDSFAVGRAGLRKRGLDDELEGVEAAFKRTAARAEDNATKYKDFERAQAAEASLVTMEIYYDDQKVNPMVDPKNPVEMVIPEPKPNAELRFTLKSSHNERVAVVLRVNGINTLYKESDDREVGRYTKWILEPGKTYNIRGFYADAKTLEKFKVLPTEATVLAQLANVAHRGLIQLDTFVEGTDESNTSAAASAGSLISLRGLSRPGLREPPPETLAELKTRMKKLASNHTIGRGIIVGGEQQTTDVKETSFKDPLHVGSIIIRYLHDNAKP